MSKGNKNFLKGAAILGLAGVIVKLVGAFFRIPLGNRIGDLGISYYMTAYPVYNFLLVVSVIGIPTAISKMVSEKDALGDHAGIRRIMSVSFWILSAVGVTTMLLLIVLARWICGAVQNPLAVYSMYSIAPALFFVSLMSVYRGYFLGIQDMKPHGVSQIIEQVFRVGVGLGLAFYLYKTSLPLAAAGATFGATVGSFVGTLYILYCYTKHRRKNLEAQAAGTFVPESNMAITKRMLAIAVPITLGSSVLPLINLIDASIVMNRLIDIGMGGVAKNLYGQLSGYAATVVNLPIVITGGVQLSLVPAVTQYVAQGAKAELEKLIETGLRLGLIIGLPCSMGLVVLSGDIMHLLYPMQPAVAASAGRILAVLGWNVLGLSLFQILTGILQGLGKPWTPARNLAVAAAVKLGLAYSLLGIPAINIYGAAASTSIAFGLAAVLNYLSLRRLQPHRLNMQLVLVKPLLAATMMAVAAKGGRLLFGLMMGGRFATLLAILLAGLVYLVILLAIKGIADEDFELLPGGGKLKKLAALVQRKPA